MHRSIMSYSQNYRHVTPPMGVQYLQPHSAGSTTTSNQSQNSSPHSVATHITTPPKSPKRQHGSVLLPRIRPQDQTLDPIAAPTHRRNTSSISSSNGFPIDFPNYVPQYHRSASPSELQMLTPVSEAFNNDYQYTNFGNIVSAAKIANLSRPASRLSQSHSHRSRSSSVTPLDDAAVRKYICPTNRAQPVFDTTRTASLPNINVSSLPPLAPSYQPPQPQYQQSSLSSELMFANYPEGTAEMTLVGYLTAPNPSPALVRRTTMPNRQFDMHFWWDVRNIRTWSSFNLETLHAVPRLTQLLNMPLPEPAFPTPSTPANLTPETVSALHDTYTTHYSTRINSALKISLGSTTPLCIRASKPAPTARNTPDFLANYSTDYERNLSGTGETRARVVGLVRAFDSWNSGKRTESPAAKIEYLRELACLHKHMRDHGCRYGYIMNEIELVCVRAGTDAVPYFGFLELAAPIQLKTHGRDELTAGLALWYLHMLAKNEPLLGQCGWKVDVGGPAALTRQNCLERDQWMVRPEGREKRDAKRNRGWVECTEPLSRKEVRKWRVR